MITNGMMTIQRGQVVDAIKALAFTANGLNTPPNDVYSTGFLDGYMTGLKAVLIVLGEELKETPKEIR